MKKILTRIFFATTLAAVLVAGSCDFNNSFIDKWWEESPVVDDGGDDDGGDDIVYYYTHDAYTVVFDSQGGNYVNLINGNTTNAPPQRVLANARATVPGLVEKDNNWFKGWYTDSSATTLWDFSDEVTETIDKSDGSDDDIITLYAGWAPGVGAGFTVVFDSFFNNSEIKPDDLVYEPLKEEIANGSYAAEPLQFGLKKESDFFEKYVFCGWYTDDNNNGTFETTDTKWEFNVDTVTADVTLHAVWAKIGTDTDAGEKPPTDVFTVRFNNTGNTTPDQSIVTGEKIVNPFVVYKSGYSFGGWYTKPDFGGTQWDFNNPVDDAYDKVSKDGDKNLVILYAKWAPVAPVDVLKDVNIVDFRYILFSGGQTEFNASAAAGSSTNLTTPEKTTNTTEIDKIADYLVKYPNYLVIVVGHANPASEADKANPLNDELITLSQGRADAVKAQIEAGLVARNSQYDVTTIKTRAEGGRRAMQQPILSRRVEIIIFDITTESVTP